jgi:hypothetical protein
VTVAADARTGRDVGFASALLYEVPELGPALHAGLFVVDTAHRGKKISIALGSSNVLGAFALHGCTAMYFTNASTQAAVLHAAGRRLSAAYPFYASTRPCDASITLATFFAEHLREDARIHSSAPFCYDRFVFLGGNRGNEFSARGDSERIEDGDVRSYYARRMDVAAGDVMVQTGRISVGTLLRSSLMSAFGGVR